MAVGNSPESSGSGVPSSAELTRQLMPAVEQVVMPLPAGLVLDQRQSFFLGRLGRMEQQRREMAGMNASDPNMRLLNKAMYSTYQDCVAAGVTGPARMMLGMQEQGK